MDDNSINMEVNLEIENERYIEKEKMKVMQLSEGYIEDDTTIYEYDYPCLRKKRCK